MNLIAEFFEKHLPGVLKMSTLTKIILFVPIVWNTVKFVGIYYSERQHDFVTPTEDRAIVVMHNNTTDKSLSFAVDGRKVDPQSGHYYLSLRPGTYKLTAMKNNYSWWIGLTSHTLIQSETVTVERGDIYDWEVPEQVTFERVLAVLLGWYMVIGLVYFFFALANGGSDSGGEGGNTPQPYEKEWTAEQYKMADKQFPYSKGGYL